MRNPISIIIALLLFFGLGFFGFSKANILEGGILNYPKYQNYKSINNYDYSSIISYNDSKIINSIFRLDDTMKNLPLLIVNNNDILFPKISPIHASPGQENLYEIDNNQIVDIIRDSSSFEGFYQKIRIDIIKLMLDNEYSNFNNEPYKNGNGAIAVDSSDFKFLKNIQEDDQLDILLKEKLDLFKNDFENIQKYENYVSFKKIEISLEDYDKFGKIFMFKNEQDLRDLGYELISRKLRINTDPDYRRHNIMTAFNNIGNVRLIMPNEIFSLAKEFHYSPYLNDDSMPYVDGYATFGDVARMVYGGGLCGVATALYQGALTNLGFDLVQYNAHSIYYRNLYEAEVNGEYISDPGLDATIFAPQYNLKIKNIREYPILVAFNFDGMSGSKEEVFTISKPQDRGSFKYIGKYKKGTEQCFTRKINGKNRTNCYRKVKNY